MSVIKKKQFQWKIGPKQATIVKYHLLFQLRSKIVENLPVAELMITKL